MPEVAIALGSNMGDRKANLRRAVELIGRDLDIESVSSVYETEPMYVEDQSWFLNLALVLKTSLAPSALLEKLQAVEKQLGRAREVRYGPRTLDADIIFYDALVVSGPGLEIPHPRMAERAFVLVPLAEIRPLMVHPVLNVTVSSLLESLKSEKKVRRVGPLGESSPRRP